MFKDITDVMLARAYAVDFVLTHAPFPPAERRHYLRHAGAWLLHRGGRALTWGGDRLAVPPAAEG